MSNHKDQTNWIDLCSSELEGLAARELVVETLRCFSGPFPRSDQAPRPEPQVSGSFSGLVRAYERSFEELEEGDWRQEVDPAQAALFTRRLRAVDELIQGLSNSQEAKVVEVMRLGLRARMSQIIELGVRPAIRLRALADFYYSRAVLLMHGLHRLDPAQLEETASRQQWTAVDGQSGLWKSHYEGSEAWGPQRVAALKIDLDRYRIEVLDLRDHAGSDDALSSRLTAMGAVGGASGGFFLYSEPDIQAPSARYDPVGLVLNRGRVLRPPVSRRAALLFCGKGVELTRVGLRDVEAYWGERRLDLGAAVIRAMSDHGPAQLSIAVLGATVCERGHSLAVPLNGFVLPWSPGWGEPPDVGDELEWRAPRLSHGAVACEGISGGPLLLRDREPCIDYRAEDFWGSAAPLTFSQDETGDRNLLARLAVGTDGEGHLYLVAIDGRQAQRALGFSLAGSAAWMRGLGCVHAANMDGGSSKRLMLLGQVLDAPTTEVTRESSGQERIRPVYSGIAILPRG